MEKTQSRAESYWWGLALGCSFLFLTGIVWYGHEIVAAVLALGVSGLGVAVVVRRWRNRVFARLLNGEGRVAEWIDEDDRPVCIGANAIFANGRFVCWRGAPKELKRAEYNPKSGIFKFVLHYPSGGVMPWRAKFSAKITVPPGAIPAALAAEQYFEPWAKNHRRHSVDPAPPTEDVGG